MALLASMNCLAQDKLEINARIDGLPEGEKVYFWRPLGSKTDSVYVKNGGFTATLDMKEGGSTYVVFVGNGGDESHGTFLYLEGGKLNIKGKGPYFKDAEYTGSKFVQDWKMIEQDVLKKDLKEDELTKLEAEMNTATQVGDHDALQELSAKAAELKKDQIKLAMDWVNKHPDVSAASYLMNAYLGNLPKQEFMAMVDKLGPNVKNTFTIKYMMEQRTGVSADFMTRVGKAAPAVEVKDNTGKTVTLNNFKGKVVLLDFWASWCKPCREQNPHLIKVYEKYKAKGFEILSVSLDEDKDKWLKAIAEDKLTWTQVVGDKGGESKIAKDYKVFALPSTIVIDREGNILKIGITPADLEQLLEKTL